MQESAKKSTTFLCYNHGVKTNTKRHKTSNIKRHTMNLYILTEERPKVSTLRFIITRFLRDKKFVAFVDNLRILPIIENGRFLFAYEIIGVRCNKIAKIYHC
ncbi:hypothetical protein [Helicobacter sp. 23-1046]